MHPRITDDVKKCIYKKWFEGFESLPMLTFDELVALCRAFFALSAVDLTILVTIVHFASDSWDSLSLTTIFCEDNSDGVAITCSTRPIIFLDGYLPGSLIFRFFFIGEVFSTSIFSNGLDLLGRFFSFGVESFVSTGSDSEIIACSSFFAIFSRRCL